MRLFLSSQDFGKFPNIFKDFLGENKKVALIQNAKDYYDKNSRIQSSKVKNTMFTDLGIESVELDLREYFGRKDELQDFLSKENVGGIWCTGGEPFLLLAAFRQSGFDEILIDFLKKDKIIYGGFSAGAMILCPDLNIYDRNLRSELTEKIYGVKPTFEGLNLIPEYILPHFSEPGKEVLSRKRYDALKSEGKAPICLTDDDVYIVDGEKSELLNGL